MRVMIVEDNEAAAWGLGIYLQKRGFTVETVLSGGEALDAVESFKPDFMLVDIGLPDIDGCDLVAQMRQVAKFRDIIFIAVTGHSDDATNARIQEAGFRKTLVKPASPLDLLELLQSEEMNK